VRRFGLILLLLVAVVGFAPATATAAGGYCTGSGVNVVVDYGTLGGGAVKACGHGSNAGDAIRSAGFGLSYDNHQGAGFVCTVNGKPADRGCAGLDSYWGLFIAKAGGGWVYASLGADAQPVSDGQTVAFAWQSSNSHRSPGVAPAPVVSSKPTAAPTTKATHKSGKHKGKHGSTAAAAPTSSPTATATAQASETATAEASATGSAKPKDKKAAAAASPSASMSSDASADNETLVASAHKTDSGGGLPWWLPVGVVVILAGGGGAVAWRRNRGMKSS